MPFINLRFLLTTKTEISKYANFTKYISPLFFKDFLNYLIYRVPSFDFYAYFYSLILEGIEYEEEFSHYLEELTYLFQLMLKYEIEFKSADCVPNTWSDEEAINFDDISIHPELFSSFTHNIYIFDQDQYSITEQELEEEDDETTHLDNFEFSENNHIESDYEEYFGDNIIYPTISAYESVGIIEENGSLNAQSLNWEDGTLDEESYEDLHHLNENYGLWDDPEFQAHFMNYAILLVMGCGQENFPVKKYQNEWQYDYTFYYRDEIIELSSFEHYDKLDSLSELYTYFNKEKFSHNRNKLDYYTNSNGLERLGVGSLGTLVKDELRATHEFNSSPADFSYGASAWGKSKNFIYENTEIDFSNCITNSVLMVNDNNPSEFVPSAMEDEENPNLDSLFLSPLVLSKYWGGFGVSDIDSFTFNAKFNLNYKKTTCVNSFFDFNKSIMFKEIKKTSKENFVIAAQSLPNNFF